MTTARGGRCETQMASSMIIPIAVATMTSSSYPHHTPSTPSTMPLSTAPRPDRVSTSALASAGNRDVVDDVGEDEIGPGPP